MSNRWAPRTIDPIEPLKSSDTEVLGIAEERELLTELARCKARLSEALDRIPNLEGVDAENADQAEITARRLALKSSQDTALGATYRRLLEVRTKLALSNMRLVAHVAKKFRDRGISYPDLIQEGFQGLLEAIDRFDLSHGTKLATYATWWIRQAMQQAVASGAYPVRLTPRHLRQLAQSQEGTPGPGNTGDDDTPSGELISRIHTATRPAVSLDAWSDVDSGFNLLQIMTEPSSDRMAEIDAGETIGRLLGVLGPREREVLALRFGLGGTERLSLSQAGSRLNVSKERIRQIQDRAIEKLRAAAVEQNLQAEFLPSD
jgi:RNA polymerase primary sigma factor